MSDNQDRRSVGRGWLGWIQLGGVIAVLMIAIYFAQAPHAPPLPNVSRGEAIVPKVFVVRPSATSYTPKIELTGEVSLSKRIEIRPLVSGRVNFVSQAMQDGGAFDADETLVSIDRIDYELALDMARAFADAQRARVRKHELEGELASEAFRKTNPGRYVPDIIAHKPQIERFRARLRGALASVEQAELDLSRTKLSLPFSGKVLRSQVTVGDLIGPPGMLATAYTNDALEVRSQLSSEELKALGDISGQTAVAVIDGNQFELFADRMGAERVRSSRLVTVFFKFATTSMEDVELQPGSFAEVTVEGKTHENVFALPNSARQLNDHVWIVKDSKVVTTKPRIQGRTSSEWLVDTFDFGDGILVGSYPGVKPGIEVEPNLQ